MTKRFLVSLLVILIGTLFNSFDLKAGILEITNFDSGYINNLGGDIVLWNKDSTDTTQGCSGTLFNDLKEGEENTCFRLEYDVNSPNSAYNGFYTRLEGIDLSAYEAVSFWVKGESNEGYTTRFKVELKNEEGETGRCVVSGVSDEWQEIIIPFGNFKNINDFGKMVKFVVVFDDILTTSKEGVIYIDDIAFRAGSE